MAATTTIPVTIKSDQGFASSVAMSHFDVRVSLEDTAQLAWDQFGDAWPSPTGGIGYGWLHDVQAWTMGRSISKTAKAFFVDLWRYERNTW